MVISRWKNGWTIGRDWLRMLSITHFRPNKACLKFILFQVVLFVTLMATFPFSNPIQVVAALKKTGVDTRLL